MSFMKGDLLTKTRKLVNGLAKPRPVWLKAMEQAPPATFPRPNGKLKAISLPEDVYIKKFFQKYPVAKGHDAIKISAYDPPPARLFGLRVLELKEQGVTEEEAMAVADVCFLCSETTCCSCFWFLLLKIANGISEGEKEKKKKAYARLKQIARLQGKKPPPNPYPSAIKERQELERKFVRERFSSPEILKIVEKIKEERRAERFNGTVGGGF
ncbi:hypothetical protein CXB51_004570 [Gossypium anomalum]|uniref:Small ribosomal subunit protein mS23 n=1 Tax=Gossypium anomalum TaxID=47600 RepID=A0A8J6DAQ4_9ROSI|nr:hypothetical protein CXB51_004570 [Gossypium anomalum]